MKKRSYNSILKSKIHLPSTAYILVAAAALSLNSCIKNDVDDKNPNPVEEFNFKTTIRKDLNLTLKSMQDVVVPGVVLEVYFQSPYSSNGQHLDSITPVAKLLTDSEGKANLNMDIPSYMTSIYLVTKFPGYGNPDTISLAGTDAEISIHPAGYNTIAEASKVSAQRSAMSKAPVNAAFTPYILPSLTNVWSLGTFNNSGVPNFLVTPDVITTLLKSKINASLPEYQAVPTSNPQFLANPEAANITLIDSCEVWATFVTEGAAWLNTLGYFYYPTNTPPSDVAQISKRIVMFPNASLGGYGGSMAEGHKVKLKYYNDKTGKWSEVFPPNVTIGWFLIASGYKNKTVTNGSYWDYSIAVLNDATIKPQQNIILWDRTEEKMIIGFEDQKRIPSIKGDQDFNDAIFYATFNPIAAVKTENMNLIKVPNDQDGDGVIDSEDEFPKDATKSFYNYSPGKNLYGTLAFEDLWPSKGDYDFNDFVTDYNFTTITNSLNKVVDIIANFKVRASGASLHNGFSFQLGISPDMIESVTGTKKYTDKISFNANGTEANQSKAVITVVDDVFSLFNAQMVNTVPGGVTLPDENITITIHLKTPANISDLGVPPYNPFIISGIDGGRGREVHLAGMAPTDLVDATLFGQGEDISNVAAKEFYIAAQNFPWALKLPVSFDYPIENTEISKALLKFNEWVKSKGATYPDWYLDKPNYRNTSLIYKK